jgi:serine/threonine-protein kinase
MGTSLLGRYVLMKPIGRGGVSVVYHAVDARVGRPTAVKLVPPHLAGDGRARDLVYREAVITHMLRHPSVPKIYDYGDDARLPDGTTVPYVVMELLTGVALASRMGDGALPWREAVSIAATVADMLAVAHRRGVVHRDLQPDNVMLTRTGVKIIDFGLARTVEVDQGPRFTRANTRDRYRRIIPAHPITQPTTAGDPADDAYSLGVLLYQMITGRSPYPEATPGTQMAAARLRCLAPTPVLLVEGLPRQVADLIRAAMAKRVDERPSSSQMALDLWSVLDHAITR